MPHDRARENPILLVQSKRVSCPPVTGVRLGDFTTHGPTIDHTKEIGVFHVYIPLLRLTAHVLIWDTRDPFWVCL